MKPIEVGREFRTNPLSKTEGGVTVVVERKNERDGGVDILEYTDVKFPDKFIEAIHRKDKYKLVIAAYVKGETN
jgi:uncharacterized protein YuzB (UPF0349 family)